jgi:hypothetical protein
MLENLNYLYKKSHNHHITIFYISDFRLNGEKNERRKKNFVRFEKKKLRRKKNPRNTEGMK